MNRMNVFTLPDTRTQYDYEGELLDTITLTENNFIALIDSFNSVIDTIEDLENTIEDLEKRLEEHKL